MSDIAHPVELHYTLTERDWIGGFAAQARVVAGGLLPHRVAVPGAMVVGGVLAGVLQHEPLVPAVAACFAVAVACLPARLWVRPSVRRHLRQNPRFTAPAHASVGAEGVAFVIADGRHTSSWVDYPCHSETRDAFVLAVSGRLSSGIYVLPKRAAAAAGDVDRLRELLGRHSTRLERRRGRCVRIPPAGGAPQPVPVRAGSVGGRPSDGPPPAAPIPSTPSTLTFSSTPAELSAPTEPSTPEDGRSLHLSFTLTEEDWVDAFAERGRVVAGPRLRLLLPALLALAGGALSLLDDRLLILTAVYLAFAVFLAARPLDSRCRPVVRRLLRSNPSLVQPAGVHLSDEGVVTRTVSSTGSERWAGYPFWIETEAAFLLLASDRLAGVVRVLPKRALAAAADVDLLRDLLGRHTIRLHRVGGRCRRVPPA